MKIRLIGLISLMAALMVAVPARAEVGTIDFGITNTLANNLTTTANVSSNSVAIASQDNCGIMLKMQGDQAGTGAITITFQRSPNNSDWETTPKFTWATALNGTTAVVAYTNLANTVIGGAGYLRILQIQNADASASATNVSVKLVKKTVRSEN